MKHILIITSYGPSLINFRISFIKKLISRGYKISVVSNEHRFSQNLQKKLKDLKIDINIISLSRTSLNFFKDFKSIFEIYKIIKALKPNIIISYTIKPVIFTGLVLKFFKNIKYFPLITGLGTIFIEKKSIKYKFLKYLVIKLYREALKKASKVIFQNKDDQYLFLELRIIKQKNISDVVNGSGVDLNLYPLSDLNSKPVFLMISRLLVEKGVKEYVEAAKIVRLRFPNAKFHLAGYLDTNPYAISSKELQSWINEGTIKYLGEIDSVQSILKSCRYYVLPSYREGTPRSVLEALSTGRPVITTDVPGCRETVIHKKNGLLVPARDTKALADAMINLLEDSDDNIRKMAFESYMIAKNKFELNKVNETMFKIMNL